MLFFDKCFVKYLMVYFVILVTLLGCRKNNVAVQAIEKSNNITIVYLEANNDLKDEAYNTINQLEQGLIGLERYNGIILAYIKTNSQKGYLLKIQPDADALLVNSDTVKVFTLNTPKLADQISRVLSYIKDNFVAKGYNLVLWSHGTSWAPPPANHNTFISKVATYQNHHHTPVSNILFRPKVKSFGEDQGLQIDIKDLRKALPMKFNYIVFDACSMAGIEVLYEFKDIANFIIASPADVLSDGFPYHHIAIDFLSNNEEKAAINIAKKYFEYYNRRSGLSRSATISVTNLCKIDSLPFKFYANNGRKSNEFIFDKVQRFDFSPDFPVPLYDFKNFIANNFDSKSAVQLEKIIESAVIYKASTNYFIGNPITEYSGITISAISEEEKFYSYYESLNWRHSVN